MKTKQFIKTIKKVIYQKNIIKKNAFTLLLLISFLFTITVKSQDYNQKTKLLFGTFHTQNTTIYGISFGAYPQPKHKRFVRTNGIRLEFPGLGILGLFGNDLADKKTDEIVNGINLSGGTMGNLKYNGITIAIFGQNGVVNNGIAIAGFSNVMNTSNGIQLSILGNGSKIMNGIQIGAWGNYADKANGIQISESNSAKHIKGMQIGGFNSAKTLKGMQIGVFNNPSFSDEKFKGIQVGAGNYASEFKGIQIGIYNKSKKTNGIQIGLWNTNEKRSFPIINWNFKQKKHK
jgi:hypothetical protein